MTGQSPFRSCMNIPEEGPYRGPAEVATTLSTAVWRVGSILIGAVFLMFGLGSFRDLLR